LRLYIYKLYIFGDNINLAVENYNQQLTRLDNIQSAQMHFSHKPVCQHYNVEWSHL